MPRAILLSLPLSAALAISAALLLLTGGATRATSFQPAIQASSSDASPGASGDLAIQLDFVAPDANFRDLVTFIPPEFAISDDVAVPNGALAGHVSALSTLGLFNNPCSSPITVAFDMMEASTDTEMTTDLWYGTQDNDGNGLPDNVDYYPFFLNLIAPGIEPRQRLYGQTNVAGIIIPLNLVVFEPGAPLPFLPEFDASLGYPTVALLLDPTAPPQPSAITDFCSPLSTTSELFGITRDNPLTDEDDAGYASRTNPTDEGRYNVVLWSRARTDADNDGIENELDPCPLSADPGWDPRAPSLGADADNDGLPASCDPDDHFFNTDQDADNFMNRLDNCPVIANFFALDSDRDGLGEPCDPVPDDYTDAGAAHTHTACEAAVLTIGAPAAGDPPAPVCPSGPDRPVPPILFVYPETFSQGVGGVHSVEASLRRGTQFEPVPAITVEFEVTGANQAQGSCLTNNGGYCAFNYQGLNEGTDTIEVSAEVDGFTLTETASAVWAVPPPNDDFAQAEVVPSLPFAASPLAAAASYEPGEPGYCGPPERSVWYRFTPQAATFVQAEAGAEQSTAFIGLYQGVSLTSLVRVGCAYHGYPDGPPPPTPTPVTPPALPTVSPVPSPAAAPSGFEAPPAYLFAWLDAGETYYFQLTSYGQSPTVDLEITQALPGDADCNGATTTWDALLQLQFISFFGPNADCLGAGDLNCSGYIDSGDVLLLLRRVAELLPPLTGCIYGPD